MIFSVKTLNKKLIDAVTTSDTTLIDVPKTSTADLTPYDLIIFASGIYYSQFEKRVIAFVEDNLSSGKKAALLYTYGAKRDGYAKKITEAILQKGSTVIGSYGCLGFDTFGPFKLVGGIARGHPNHILIMRVFPSPQVHANQADEVYLRVGDKSLP